MIEGAETVGTSVAERMLSTEGWEKDFQDGKQMREWAHFTMAEYDNNEKKHPLPYEECIAWIPPYLSKNKVWRALYSLQS